MIYQYNDGGRKAAGYNGIAGDCVVRAVAIAAALPYQEVYEALSDGMRTQRRTKRSGPRASARNGVSVKRKWFKDYMREIGFSWTPCMSIGTGCRVHLHDGELPNGRLVVSLSRHYTAVVNQTILDTYDPRRETLFPNDAGGYRVAHRCVYGFYRFNDDAN